MVKHLDKLCLACKKILTGRNWAAHISTIVHEKTMKDLGGIDPGFKLIRDLDPLPGSPEPASVKTDRHL